MIYPVLPLAKINHDIHAMGDGFLHNEILNRIEVEFRHSRMDTTQSYA